MPPKTSGKAAKKSGKATKAIAKGDKKKRNKKRKESTPLWKDWNRLEDKLVMLRRVGINSYARTY